MPSRKLQHRGAPRLVRWTSDPYVEFERMVFRNLFESFCPMRSQAHLDWPLGGDLAVARSRSAGRSLCRLRRDRHCHQHSLRMRRRGDSRRSGPISAPPRSKHLQAEREIAMSIQCLSSPAVTGSSLSQALLKLIEVIEEENTVLRDHSIVFHRASPTGRTRRCENSWRLNVLKPSSGRRACRDLLRGCQLRFAPMLDFSSCTSVRWAR